MPVDGKAQREVDEGLWEPDHDRSHHEVVQGELGKAYGFGDVGAALQRAALQSLDGVGIHAERAEARSGHPPTTGITLNDDGGCALHEDRRKFRGRGEALADTAVEGGRDAGSHRNIGHKLRRCKRVPAVAKMSRSPLMPKAFLPMTSTPAVSVSARRYVDCGPIPR